MKITKMELGYDTNGNQTLKIKVEGSRAVSIQTLGNLPHTHREGVSTTTAGEVRRYVEEFGTSRQKELLGMR